MTSNRSARGRGGRRTGLSITNSYVSFVDKKRVTIQYPDVRRPLSRRARWRHVLNRYDNGLEKCIGCSLCAGACPANAIHVKAAENTPEDRRSPEGAAMRRSTRSTCSAAYSADIAKKLVSDTGRAAQGHLRAGRRRAQGSDLHQRDAPRARADRLAHQRDTWAA